MFKKEKEQEIQRREKEIKTVWEYLLPHEAHARETLQRGVPRQEDQTVASFSHFTSHSQGTCTLYNRCIIVTYILLVPTQEVAGLNKSQAHPVAGRRSLD